MKSKKRTQSAILRCFFHVDDIYWLCLSESKSWLVKHWNVHVTRRWSSNSKIAPRKRERKVERFEFPNQKYAKEIFFPVKSECFRVNSLNVSQGRWLSPLGEIWFSPDFHFHGDSVVESVYCIVRTFLRYMCPCRVSPSFDYSAALLHRMCGVFVGECSFYVVEFWLKIYGVIQEELLRCVASAERCVWRTDQESL